MTLASGRIVAVLSPGEECKERYWPGLSESL